MSNFCVTNDASIAYDEDFHKWTQQQSRFLREEKWSCLDIPNLVEEIESLGRQEQRELENRLGVLLGHLLKWEFQSDKQSKSWRSTIREQRRRIQRLLKKSPSLQPYLPQVLEDAYQDGLDLVIRETSLDEENPPSECPYRLEEVLSFEFFPVQEIATEEDLVR
jgi:hypothetical protein